VGTVPREVRLHEDAAVPDKMESPSAGKFVDFLVVACTRIRIVTVARILHKLRNLGMRLLLMDMAFLAEPDRRVAAAIVSQVEESAGTPESAVIRNLATWQPFR
jgi:hypothetical protein